MAWGKLGSTTLTTTADNIDTSVFTTNKFITLLSHVINSGAVNIGHRVGNTTLDTGSNYAKRTSLSGGSELTPTSQSNWIEDGLSHSGDNFMISNIINIADEEKLAIVFATQSNTAGAGNAPSRTEQVSKWTNTSNQFDIISTINYGSGDFDTDSNLSALGSDMTPAAAEDVKIQNGAIFEETDTNKHYLLDDGTWTEI